MRTKARYFSRPRDVGRHSGRRGSNISSTCYVMHGTKVKVNARVKVIPILGLIPRLRLVSNSRPLSVKVGRDLAKTCLFRQAKSSTNIFKYDLLGVISKSFFFQSVNCSL